MRAQNCMSCLIQTKKILEILGGGNTSQQPSLLHTAKINGKMLSLGDKSEVPFALPRGKCLASSPHPNLGNRLIRTLQKAKRRGLEGPFPWGHPAHQLQGRRAAGPQPFPGMGATTLLCVSGSRQAPSLSSGPDPYPFHPTRQREKCYQAAARRRIWPCLQIQPRLLSTVWQEMPPEGWWWGGVVSSFPSLWVRESTHGFERHRIPAAQGVSFLLCSL